MRIFNLKIRYGYMGGYGLITEHDIGKLSNLMKMGIIKHTIITGLCLLKLIDLA